MVIPYKVLSKFSIFYSFLCLSLGYPPLPLQDVEGCRGIHLSPCTPPHPEKVTNGSVTIEALLGSKQTIAGVPQRIWNTIHPYIHPYSKSPTSPQNQGSWHIKRTLMSHIDPYKVLHNFDILGWNISIYSPISSMEYIASIWILHAFLQSLYRIQKVTWR